MDDSDLDLELHPKATDITTHLAPLRTDGCWVCGQPASNKCSSCLSFGFEIRFCSAEHQRMVWPFHRHVCGSRSNPFRLPDLSKEQVSRLSTNSRTVIEVIDQSIEPNAPNAEGDPSFWIKDERVGDFLTDFAGFPRGTFESRWIPAAQDGFPFSPLRRRDAILACHHALAKLDALDGQQEPTLPSYTDWPARLTEWIFRIAVIDHDFFQHISDRFLHRAVIAISLCNILAGDRDSFEHWVLLEHALEQLVLAAAENRTFVDRIQAAEFARFITWSVHKLVCVRVNLIYQPSNKSPTSITGVDCLALRECSHPHPDADSPPGVILHDMNTKEEITAAAHAMVSQWMKNDPIWQNWDENLLADENAGSTPSCPS